MWRSKKVIVGAVLAVVLLFGSLGGVALANNGDDSAPKARFGELLDRVSEIYQEKTGANLDQEALKDAFAQARNEMQKEATQNRLKSMVEQGMITQEQADEFLQWQQSRPDVPFGFGFKGHGGPRGFPGPHMPPNGQ